MSFRYSDIKEASAIGGSKFSQGCTRFHSGSDSAYRFVVSRKFAERLGKNVGKCCAAMLWLSGINIETGYPVKDFRFKLGRLVAFSLDGTNMNQNRTVTH